jgi:hypothetical protein
VADRRNYDLAESWVVVHRWQNAVSDSAGNLTRGKKSYSLARGASDVDCHDTDWHSSDHSRTTLIISSARPAVAPYQPYHLRG